MRKTLPISLQLVGISALLCALLAPPLVSSFLHPASRKAQRSRSSFATNEHLWQLACLSSKDDVRITQDHSSSHSSWQSHISTHPDAASALAKLLDNLNLPNNPPDIAFLFVSQFHGSMFERIVEQAAAQLTSKCRLVSVVGGGVIGEHSELDEPSKPGMSLLVGFDLPANSVELFDFNELRNPPPAADSSYWKKLAGSHGNDAPPESASYLLFADPWSPVENVTAALGDDAVIAGGISVPTGVGPTVAIDNRPMSQGSIVGVCFKPASSLKLQVVVAQGCRPVVGPVPYWTITEAQGSCILELDGQPAMTVLQNLISSIQDTNEQMSISSGLVCGIQAHAKSQHHYSDDYLIRQILGFVPSKGGILVAGGVRKGDRLQFHVRDPRSAREDLQLMMQRARTERAVFAEDHGRIVAAVQISCIARGRGLFGDTNVDLTGILSLLNGGGASPTAFENGATDDGSKTWRSPAVGGFYANGEIGPVGIAGFSSQNRLGGGSGTYLHGFTTVAAYICDTSDVVNNQKNSLPSSTLIGEPDNAWG